jgi:hypothetical protein
MTRAFQVIYHAVVSDIQAVNLREMAMFSNLELQATCVATHLVLSDFAALRVADLLEASRRL